MTEPYLSDFATEAAADRLPHRGRVWRQDLRQLAERHPEIAELHEIGRSVENRPMWALRIGERRGSDRKVAFLGCHHAREWISVEVPYLLAEHLVDNASTEPVRSWLQQGEVWVAPMVNPDGHEYTRTHEPAVAQEPAPEPRRQHRRRPQPQLRLHVGHAGRQHLQPRPSDETYVGPRAFSEPETRAVRNLVARELFGGVLTYHSYSQLILYPWGYTDRAGRGRGRPARDAGLAERHAAADQRRARPDLHRAAVVASCTRRRATPPTGPTASTTSPRSRSSCGRPPPWRAGSSCPPTRSSPAGRRTVRPHWRSSGTSSTSRSPEDSR